MFPGSRLNNKFAFVTGMGRGHAHNICSCSRRACNQRCGLAVQGCGHNQSDGGWVRVLRKSSDRTEGEARRYHQVDGRQGWLLVKVVAAISAVLFGVKMGFFKTLCLGLQVLKSMQKQEAQTLDLSRGTSPAIGVGTK